MHFGFETATYMGSTSHQGVVCKALIQVRIRNLKDATIQNGMRTKRDIPSSFAHFKPLARFEPLSICIHQRYQCDGNPQHLLRQPRDARGSSTSAVVTHAGTDRLAHRVTARFQTPRR